MEFLRSAREKVEGAITEAEIAYEMIRDDFRQANIEDTAAVLKMADRFVQFSPTVKSDFLRDHPEYQSCLEEWQ